jgi:hypothetical protein
VQRLARQQLHGDEVPATPQGTSNSVVMVYNR